jgi:hypothetical protein
VAKTVERRAVLEFDAQGLFAAMDAQRRERALTWQGVATELWDQSAALNHRRHDHPISPATLTNIATRDAVSCQHALFILRWLGKSPESLLKGGTVNVRTALPAALSDRRLRWDLSALYGALDECRTSIPLTWTALADELRCTPSQLTGIRRARFSMDMALAMRVTQWIGRPAADFIYPSDW